jgi:hypothetical protein
VAGGTFLSLIPLLTEAEAPFYMPPFFCTKFTRDIMGYFRPPPKTALSTVENNSGCLSTGLPPWGLA